MGLDDIGLPLPWGIVPAQRLFRVFVGPDPAAGAEAVLSVPGTEFWDVLTVSVVLVTSAVAGSRNPSLQASDGTTVFARFGGVPGQVLGTTTRHTWFPGGVDTMGSAASGQVSYTMPRLLLMPNYVLSTVTQALDVGDNYGPPVAYVVAYQVRGLERALERYERALIAATAAPG